MTLSSFCLIITMPVNIVEFAQSDKPKMQRKQGTYLVRNLRRIIMVVHHGDTITI